MKVYHPELASGRWFTFSIAEQLANVGSEYERARKAKEIGDRERFTHALARMLELMDLTIADSRWRNHRLKELCRVRGIACEQLCSDNPEPWARQDLRDYFLHFAILSRNETYKSRAVRAAS
jgi:hypothetical protein